MSLWASPALRLSVERVSFFLLGPLDPLNRIPRPRRLAFTFACFALLAVAPAFGAGVAAQEPVELFAGDSIRVDGEIVGRILSIQGPTMIVVSREAPRCRAGEGHGDAPICDPAPLVRHTMNMDEVIIEQRLEKPHLMTRTVIGGLLGAGAFGVAGYFIGPEIGFGRVDGCLVNSSEVSCGSGEKRYTQEQIDARQLASDQKKGAFFFGVIGGTATAVLVNKLSKGWVRIEPVIAVSDEDPWGLSVSVPAFR